MAQTITSANTSINSTRLPKVYGMLGKLIKKHHIYGGAMLDYGCGKYTEHLQAEAKRFGFSDWRGYDKFNRTDEENKDAEYWMKPGLYDLAVCSNVLNVIDDREEIQKIVDSVIASANVSIFTIYEGDGSGIGRQTKKDCYQRNAKLEEYWTFFMNNNVPCYKVVTLENNYFIVDKRL